MEKSLTWRKVPLILRGSRTAMTQRTPRTPVAGAATLGAMLALTALLVPPAAAHSRPGPVGSHAVDYVALGDSLASGPGIPQQVDANCLRSSNNYPSLVAARLQTHTIDVSCSGASTASMTGPQGTAGPQLGALSRATDLVTISVGVNDIGINGAGFTSIISTCAALTSSDPTGSPCKDALGASGSDELLANISGAAPKVAATLAGIHRRAPHAELMVIGYPDLFPENGDSCTSATVPLAAGDFGYLQNAEKALNAMLSREAKQARATYVDTYTPTIGHDMCQPEGVRWIEPIVPASPTIAPAHPNASGHKMMATAVERRLHHRAMAR